MVGRVLVTDVMKMKIPKPQTLGRMTGRGALSGDVIALDSQSIMVKDLIFGGNQPGKDTSTIYELNADTSSFQTHSSWLELVPGLVHMGHRFLMKEDP